MFRPLFLANYTAGARVMNAGSDVLMAGCNTLTSRD
jgi:hypothetical protein